MKNTFLRYVAPILVLLALIGASACAAPAPTPTPEPTPTPAPAPAPAPPPTPAPTPAAATFKVTSLDIKPLEVMAGETVSITAVVENTGGSEGTYAVILTVDGVTVETEEVAIAPGSSKVVTFSLAKNTAGTYQVGIGDLTSSLVVKEKPSVAKELELKHDVSKGKDCLSSDGGGYIIDFTPPVTPFTITKVRMVGVLYGSGWEGKQFSVAIWNKDYQALHVETYPVTLFPVEKSAWVEVEIPNIEVTDKFYVHVYTGTKRMEGIQISADASVVNEHSDLTVRTAEGVFKIRKTWPWSSSVWFGDKSKVNWKIRVVGTMVEKQ